MKPLELVNQSQVPMPRQWIANWMRTLQKILVKASGKNLEVFAQPLSVVFLDEPAARKLNLKYRSKNYATDILSFDLQPGGELVLCPQVLKRQAREHGLSFKAELGYMLLHGTLHLMGYEHEGSKAKARQMFQIQDRVFALAAKKLKMSL